MRRFSRLLAILSASWLFTASSFALTVDEVIKLKQAGVADSTIELLIKRSGDARTAGVWKQDGGWIVHATPSREPRDDSAARYQDDYPLTIYPRVIVGPRK